MKILDISPEISEALAVWPKDSPFCREILMDTDQGDHLGLSKVSMTLHLGAHADAPNHYATQSVGISERSLYYYFGPCQVISVDTVKGSSVEPSHLQTQVIKAPRVLIKTGSFPNPQNWNDDFCSVSPTLIDFLSDQHVLLVGIDTPSVDPFHSKKLEAHQRIHRYNMAILEGLVLDSVPDGIYQLCALPLKIKDGDASPVRAVLIEN